MTSNYHPVPAETKPCEYCGVEFTAPSYKHYCSPMCSHSARLARGAARRRSDNLPPIPPHPCAGPGCTNTVYPGYHRPNQMYCGSKCRRAAGRIKEKEAKAAGLAPVPDDNSKHRAHADASRKQDEAERMDAIVLRAWEKAQGYDRAIIEANPLNRHLFQGA